MAARAQLAPPQFRMGPGSESAHWYRHVPETGATECCYEILGANGNWRSVDMRDARKWGLWPGCSSITRQEAAPALERWKRKQTMLAALTHPSLHLVENDDLKFDVVERDAAEQAKAAAAKGTLIHKAVEIYFQTGAIDPAYEPYITGVREQLYLLTGVDSRQAWTTEVAACHPFGYGCRVDLLSKSLGCTIDFKGKDFDETWKADAWPEQARQLAANREAANPGSRCINLFISRNNPGLVKPYEWEPSKIAKAWEEFVCLLTFWQVRNSFPRLAKL